MQILDVTKIGASIVETDEEPWGNYMRYSSDNWFQTMGESDEPVYDCEELEKEFQQYQHKRMDFMS